MKQWVVLLCMYAGSAQAQSYDYFGHYDYRNSFQSYEYPEYLPIYQQREEYSANYNYYEGQNLTNSEAKSTPSEDASNQIQQAAIPQELAAPSKDTKKKDGKIKEQELEKKEEEKPKSPHGFTGSVNFISDYRFRGISQTMRQPAIQGTLEYSYKGGLYLGTFGSNIDGTTHFYNNTSMEWDFYGGYRGKVLPCRIPDLAYDIGVIYYFYPGGRAHVPKNDRYNTFEYYIGLSYKWFTIKFWQSLTDYFGDNSDNPPFNWKKKRFDRPNGSSRYSTNIEASALFELWEKFCCHCLHGGKLSLLVAVGHTAVRNYEHLSYTHWRATLTQEFDWFSFFFTYVGTDAKHAYFDVPDNAHHPKKHALGAQGIVIGMIRSF